MITISSGHFSHADQVKDAVSYIEHNMPDKFAAFKEAFPKWDTPNIGDLESGHWMADWIEDNTPIFWWEGEPIMLKPGEPDDDPDDVLDPEDWT